MQLLVSVASAADVPAALDGGADVIDAKNPSAGALGAVTLETLREIHTAVAGRRPVTAALGDAADENAVQRAARAFAAAGASLVKIGFAGVTSASRAAALAAAAVRGAEDGADDLGAGRCGVIVVGYADAARVGSLAPADIIEVALQSGAVGVLIDTADKTGPALLELIAAPDLAVWIAEARAGGLLVALAGRLAADDLPVVRAAGADVAGVRGAACDGGRDGRVALARVRTLRALCEPAGGAAPPAAFDGSRTVSIG